jgi:hypothetical protein
MNHMIGKVINQYKILEMLGRGGMGIVYRAHDTELDRDVALKTMDVLMASDPNFLRRFQSEARALAKLNDPNIVSVFNLLETPEGVCIVMELVKGRTLSALLKETPLLPLPRVIRIFRQVFAALDHAHKEGVIHRDIKPGNVMLTNADVVKVTDFGLAKIQTRTGTTVTKGTAGTLFYMSPEQIRGLGQVDHRGDIYSAGMALYECLAGALPFKPDSSEYTIANMIVEGLITPPDKINQALPKDLARIVMTAIDNDVAKRYQSAGEVLTALQRFSGGKGVPEFDLREKGTMGAAYASLVRPYAGTGRPRWKLYSTLLVGAFLLGVLYFALRLSVFPPAGKLTVQTDPAGAQIIIDQAAARTSPVPDVTLSPGRHHVNARWDEVQIDTTVTIMAGQSALLSMTRGASPSAAAGGGIEVRTGGGPGASANPAGAAHLTLIAIPEGEAAVDDGSYQPAHAALTLGVSAGRRRVRFRSNSGVVRERRVDLRAGGASTIRCYFQGVVQVEATLEYISSPAAIVVDGVPRRESAPGNITVPAGKHRIGVRMENYVSVPPEVTMTVEPSFDSPRNYKATFRMKREQ